jgi:transposase-like protein
VLESYVTKTRDKSAALWFIRKALKRHGQTAEIVTDGLRSYPAALKELNPGQRRRSGRWVNNRAENSHPPFRQREAANCGFRSMQSLQKFVSVHASICNHFNLNAISSLAKPTNFAAQPPRSRGALSRHKGMRTSGLSRQTETSSH